MHLYDSLVSMQESIFVYLQKSKKAMVVGIISSIHWVNYKFVSYAYWTMHHLDI